MGYRCPGAFVHHRRLGSGVADGQKDTHCCLSVQSITFKWAKAAVVSDAAATADVTLDDLRDDELLSDCPADRTAE